ncbi:general secretion pathway protein GspK [Arenimonas daejeonensis]|uniref:general secretion pathway protein GspK n=1 Tax=Arenimonas daejeonensis TaxID=370777 RepID=UPI0011BE3681|nr:general secretion pathway protein GspK [Arenimonas daejeonensis]
MPRMRGAALLLVLWLLLLMAGLVSVFALGARTEALQGSALRAQVAGRLAAEAGIEVAALRLSAPDANQRWVPDARPNSFRFEDYQLEVRVQDEAGKFDLNVADVRQLAVLMRVLGVEEFRARALAGAIQDWRDPDQLLAVEGGAEDRDYAAADLPYGAKDQPFTTLSELQQLLGMDEATYRLLVPYVTVYTARSQPDPSFAQAPVLQAMGLDPVQLAQLLAAREAWQPGLPVPLQPDGTALAVVGSGTYSVASRATRPDGSQVEITATLRMGAGSGFGQLYAPLAWRAGEPD